MTDEELMTALECCSQGYACPKCPAHINEYICETVPKNALKIIKELKTENTALHEKLEKAIELPCKVGDTIYELLANNTILEWTVHSIFVSSLGFDVNCERKDYTEHKRFIIRKNQNDLGSNGKGCLTYEAAKAKLKEKQ